MAVPKDKKLTSLQESISIKDDEAQIRKGHTIWYKNEKIFDLDSYTTAQIKEEIITRFTTECDEYHGKLKIIYLEGVFDILQDNPQHTNKENIDLSAIINDAEDNLLVKLLTSLTKETRDIFQNTEKKPDLRRQYGNYTFSNDITKCIEVLVEKLRANTNIKCMLLDITGEALTKRGIKVVGASDKRRYFLTPIHCLINEWSFRMNKNMIEYLLKHGASISVSYSYTKRTHDKKQARFDCKLLQFCIMFDNLDVFKLLAKYDASMIRGGVINKKQYSFYSYYGYERRITRYNLFDYCLRVKAKNILRYMADIIVFAESKNSKESEWKENKDKDKDKDSTVQYENFKFDINPNDPVDKIGIESFGRIMSSFTGFGTFYDSNPFDIAASDNDFDTLKFIIENFFKRIKGGNKIIKEGINHHENCGYNLVKRFVGAKIGFLSKTDQSKYNEMEIERFDYLLRLGLEMKEILGFASSGSYIRSKLCEFLHGICENSPDNALDLIKMIFNVNVDDKKYSHSVDLVCFLVFVFWRLSACWYWSV